MAAADAPSPEAFEDEVDGDTDSDSSSPEPLDLTGDDRRLVTQPYDFSVAQLVSDVASGKIVLIDIPYQRQYVWDDTKASRLIESLLLNVPIPVCYFAEDEDGTWEVIDGLQRAHSIVRFVGDKLTLRGLSVLSELNGNSFRELPTRDQRRIETRTLRFVVITEESHPDIRFDVFERLNTGSVKLTPQELRNCIYRGTLNDALRNLVMDESFRQAVGHPLDQRMGDEELVLRFLALADNLTGYKPPLTQFLNEYMREHRHEELTAAQVDLFRRTMALVHRVFGATAFRGVRPNGQLSGLNRALFDAVTLSMAFADGTRVEENSENLRNRHLQLVADAEFTPLIGRATADRTRMHGRVRRYASMLDALGIPVQLPELPVE